MVNLPIKLEKFDCRLTSLKAIINVHKFSVIVLNETHFQAGRKMDLQGYTSYTRNRTERISGGISTSVANSESEYCVRVDEGIGRNEFLVTRHSQFVTPINVINTDNKNGE